MNFCRPVQSPVPYLASFPVSSPLSFILLLACCGAVVPVFAQDSNVRAVSGSSTTLAAADARNSGSASKSAPAPAAAKAPATDVTHPGLLPTVAIVPHVQTQVEVNAHQQALESSVAAPYHVTSTEVLSSAGTWGDFTRYLQLLPGVVWNTDMSNDVMVRGGSPEENLYVVDGIEVPNINHIALEGTTGGFTSMLDTSTIGSVDLKAGEYDARYSSRLSSLVDIHTLAGEPALTPGIDNRRSGEVDAGISGVGGFLNQPMGKTGNLLLSAHRSILNLATNDIGINGVPIYTNGLAHLESSPSSRDRISALSLSGADSIDMTPQPCDNGVTSLVQTQYGGVRSTNGLVWQHTHTPSILSTVTASYSAQTQLIGQQLQLPFEGGTGACWNHPFQTSPLYQEQSRDGIGTLAYGLEFSAGAWLFSLGETGRLVQSKYVVAQPLGQQSPFNPNPAWTDADNFARNLVTGQTASYAEATAQLGARWTLIAGAREETFAITGAHAFDPRASIGLRIASRQALHASFERSAQLAPTIDLLSYAQNARLLPIGMEQFAAGAELWSSGSITASIDAYTKRYFNEPESTEYPSLMLANMVDTLGQQFVWLPLKSGGRGRSQGVELLLRAHRGDHLELLSSASYSKTLYAASDGILRPGNFDFPFVANGMATLELPGKLFAAFRDTFASGRPYTPFNIAASEQQSRGIYNLEELNALRGPAYNRVDADFHRAFHVHGGLLNIYGGVENAFNHPNFLGYAWESECRAPYGAICGESINAIPGVPEYKVTQMPRFPSAGARFVF
jgi:TonB dependent receptor/TonB-dependent Receptor Plug Domain